MMSHAQIGSKFIDQKSLNSKEQQQIPFSINFESYIDPFFKKTSQMFDEANASGLLVNNLQIQRNNIITLDSDSFIQDENFPKKDQLYTKQLPYQVVKSIRESLEQREISQDLKSFIMDLKDNIDRVQEYGQIYP